MSPLHPFPHFGDKLRIGAPERRRGLFERPSARFRRTTVPINPPTEITGPMTKSAASNRRTAASSEAAGLMVTGGHVMTSPTVLPIAFRYSRAS
jgi:hypothetical protein